MKMEMKMLIKQLNSSTKEGMIAELKGMECEDGEIQTLVDETIQVIEELTDKELLVIKSELLSVY